MYASTLSQLNTWYPDLVGSNDSFSIAFTVAGLHVRWYAIMSMIGYITAIGIYILSIWKRYKISVDVGFYYIFIAIPMILLGARFWSACIGDLQWENFFSFGTGGLAIQGGVVFGIIAALIYFPIILHFPKFHAKVVENGHVYIQRPSMWLYADAIVPTILLGQAIGRWGNFFNGELFGRPVDANDLAWLKAIMPGVYNHMFSTAGATIPLDHEFWNTPFDSGNTAVNPKTGEVVHIAVVGTFFQPLFLYESFMNVIAFAMIYGLVAEIRSARAGVPTSLYFVFYGIIRFIDESQRNQDFTFLGTYVLNAILLIIGVLIFIYAQFLSVHVRKYHVMYMMRVKIEYSWKLLKAKFIRSEYKKLLTKEYIESMMTNKVKVENPLDVKAISEGKKIDSQNKQVKKFVNAKMIAWDESNMPNPETYGCSQKPKFLRSYGGDQIYFAFR